MQISVIGLGKLGAPLAAVFAGSGHDVVGVDLDQYVVDTINRGEAPVDEQGLSELVAASGGRLTATAIVADAVAASVATFVVVPTPSTEDGSFSNHMVMEAVEAIGGALRDKQGGRHLVVITSTVMPGSCQGPIRTALESASGMRVGKDIGLCYSPEFIALGSVIDDIRRADFILVGESDPEAGTALAEILTGISDADPPVMRMNLVNAEVAKLAVNTFVTTKISYANMLAEICSTLPGADADVVTAAVGLDSRVGPKYMRPATPFGGPCFPRDNRALSRLARNAGVSADIADATQAVNQRQAAGLVAMVAARVSPPARVAVLGLAYKPGTSVADASAGVEIAQLLDDRGYKVVVYDPAAMENARLTLGDRIGYAVRPDEAVSGADAVIIATAWPEFRDFDPTRLGAEGRRPVILDCWRLLDDNAFDGSAEIVHPGAGAVPGDDRPQDGPVAQSAQTRA